MHGQIFGSLLTFKVPTVGISSKLAHVVEANPSCRPDMMRNLLSLWLQCSKDLYARGSVSDYGNALILALGRLIPSTGMMQLSLEVL